MPFAAYEANGILILLGLNMNAETSLNAEYLGKLLSQQHRKITTAESCTGGGLAAAITSVAGSSAWFECGIVSYSYAAKVRLLQVSQQTLDQYGQVSQQVAKEMATGALALSNADLAVAITGIAGPSGGSLPKPVGTVYIAWQLQNGNADYSRQLFTGNRTQVQTQAVNFALRRCILLLE